ncbi:hypothetical protein D3C76_753820 [compost metagenome]
MGDAQHTVDQVEFQLLHTRQLAEFVLDQCLLGRTIHGLNAETAQPRASGRRFAQLDQRRRRCFRRTAGITMGMFLHRLQFVAVIVLSLGLVGMKGIAHRVASLKVPVAK